ncbi:hypothetical protein CUC08_Gglean003488 [Alternaria sp. MG1]|nr:hypothetical protein CUC08_Gglean003488 [Alternaria sp. MG1]
MLSVVAVAVMGIADVRRAYAIDVGRDVMETGCITCNSDSPPTNTIGVRTIASATSIIVDQGVSSGHLPLEEIAYTPSAPTKHSPRPSPQLTATAKAGIIAASIAVFVILLLLVLEYTYLRRKRRDRDLERAIDEVEDGTELKESTASESKENMVLESRVEIVIEEEQRSESDSWDGESQWGVGTDREDSDGDLGEWGRGGGWERGRNGMSLSRTES